MKDSPAGACVGPLLGEHRPPSAIIEVYYYSLGGVGGIALTGI